MHVLHLKVGAAIRVSNCDKRSSLLLLTTIYREKALQNWSQFKLRRNLKNALANVIKITAVNYDSNEMNNDIHCMHDIMQCTRLHGNLLSYGFNLKL